MTDNTEALPPMCEPPRFFELLRELAETGHISGLGITSEAMTRVRAALAQRQRVPAEFETRADGKVVRRDRWEWGIRSIVAMLWGNRHEFEIDEVVEAVRALIPASNEDDLALLKSVAALTAAPSAQAEPVAFTSQHQIEELRARKAGFAGRPDYLYAHAEPGGIYTVPLYAAPPAAQAEPQEPLTDEHISALYVSGWGAYCSRASFIAIFREAERVHRIGKQEPHS